MAKPVGLLEWEPGRDTATGRRVRIFSLDENGLDDTDNQSNYHVYRWNATDSFDIGGTVYEVAAYWRVSTHLVIKVRTQPYGAWTTYTYDGTGGLPSIFRAAADNHNNVNVGIDHDGYLHVAYDHHADPLNYRRSDAPLNTWTGGVTAELSMVGTNESQVSYPTFFRGPAGDFYFVFRDGISGDGDLYWYKYTHSGQTWAGVGGTTAGKVIDGKNSTPDDVNPYWHGPPRFTSDWDGAGTGYAYLGWTWRISGGDSTNVLCVRWNGTTGWSTAGGSAQTIPVTRSNADVAASVSTTTSLSNFNAVVLDSSNRPHLFNAWDDPGDSNRSKIWHVYHNGTSWSSTAVTPSDPAVDYELNGVDAVIDPDDTIRVIACHPVGIGNGIYAWVSDGSSWGTVPWTMETLTGRDTTVVDTTHRTNVGGHHDHRLWAEDGVYRMMVPFRGSDWRANTDDPADWSGYIEATADAPSALTHDQVLKVSIDSSETEFWAAVKSDGGDVRVFAGDGQQLPFDLVEWNYAGQYALLNVLYMGEFSTGPTVRVYAGNAGASAPAAADAHGQYHTYPEWCWGYWPSGGGNDRTRWANDFTMTGSPTTTAATGPMGQTTYEYSGSGQYGLTTVKFPTAGPILFRSRFKSDSATAGQVVLSVSDTSADNYWFLAAQGNVASDPLRAGVREAPAIIGNSDRIGYTTGTWHHGVGRFTATNSRVAVLDGTAGTADTTSVTPSSLDRMGVAVLARGALDSQFDGRLADTQLWVGQPSTQDDAYDSAQSNQTTFWNGWTWTATGGGGGGGARRRRILLRGG